MSYENTIEINDQAWTQVNLPAGSYYIESVDPSNVIEYSLNSNGSDPFTITSGSAQYTLDRASSMYFKAASLFNGNTTKVYINDFSTKASAPLAAPSAQSAQITNQWTQVSFGAGSYFVIPEAGNNIVSMSLSQTGANSKALKRGGEQLSLNSPTAVYFKLNTEDATATATIKYNTVNVIASTGGGSGPGPTPTPTTYTFNSPLSEANGVVSLRYTNEFNLNNNQLALDLNNNIDFQNLEISVQNNEADIVVLQNDVADNKTEIGNIKTTAVFVTGNQTIDGVKTFNSSPVVPTPINLTDAANKDYVDNEIAKTTLTFSGALNKTGNDVSIGLESDITLNPAGDKLTLSLNNNADFRNALLAINDAKRIATYTEVGRVMPKEHDFVMNGLNGEMSLDLTATGTLKQNFVDLSSQQIVDGEKDFVKELRANNLVTHENGVGYGSVDIRNQDGYFSISENGGAAAANLLAAIGFVDSTTTLRIRNLAGALITFDQIVQYEQTFTPTDDKDLVPYKTLRDTREELINLIQSLQGFVHWVGVIPHTFQECEADPGLLTQFVQQEETRAPRSGDFVKTNDSYGFIYNGTKWVSFGQISITLATTTTAGIVMLGTNAGELEDIGNGKVKVIGWDTVVSGLQDLHTRTTDNTNDITSLKGSVGTLQTSVQQNSGAITTLQGEVANKANTADVVTLAGDQTITGIKTVAGDFNVNGNLKAGSRLYFNSSVPSIAPLTNNKGTIYMANTQIGTSCYYDMDFGNLGIVSGIVAPTQGSHAANKNYVDGITNGTRPFGTSIKAGVGSGYVRFTPEDDSVKKLYFRNTAVGNTNRFDLDLENNSSLTGIKTPVNDSDASNKKYVDDKFNGISTNYVSLTGDQSIAGKKDFTNATLCKNNDRTYGSVRYYSDNAASGSGNPIFNTYGTKTERQAYVGFSSSTEPGKFEFKIESVTSRPNPKFLLSNNTEINGTLNITGNVSAPNLPVVYPNGTAPTSLNLQNGQIAFISRR